VPTVICLGGTQRNHRAKTAGSLLDRLLVRFRLRAGTFSDSMQTHRRQTRFRRVSVSEYPSEIETAFALRSFEIDGQLRKESETCDDGRETEGVAGAANDPRSPSLATGVAP